MPPKKKSNKKGSAESGGGDWLASLARQSTASDKGAKGGAQQSQSHATTKEERIQRREQKKLERQERKRVAEEKRDAKKLLLQQKKRKRNERDGGTSEQRIRNTSTSSLATRPSPIIDAPRKRKGKRGGMTEFSKRALVKLCNNIESTVAQYDDTSLTTHQGKKQHKKHKSIDQQNDDNTAKQQLIINGVPADPKGKATKSSTLRPDSKELQPRIRDYNGQGLVRRSLFLPLNDPSFVPKLELEFAEHIPGFFGKAKTKAAKKQSDEKMLWRRCLKAKEEEEGGSGKKKKKKNRQGGDDRFESMIRQDIM